MFNRRIIWVCSIAHLLKLFHDRRLMSFQFMCWSYNSTSVGYLIFKCSFLMMASWMTFYRCAFNHGFRKCCLSQLAWILRLVHSEVALKFQCCLIWKDKLVQKAWMIVRYVGRCHSYSHEKIQSMLWHRKWPGDLGRSADIVTLCCVSVD